MSTRYVNTASTAGGDGTTNNTTGATRAYASMTEAVAQDLDLVTDTDIQTIYCDGGADDIGGGVNFVGWTTDASYYVKVEPTAGNEASSVWDTGIYHCKKTTGSGEVFRFFIACRINNLQFENNSDLAGDDSGSGLSGAGYSGSGAQHITNNLIKYSGVYQTPSYSVGIDGGDCNLYVVNNGVFGLWHTGIGQNYNNGGQDSVCYSNTVIDAYDTGIEWNRGWVSGVYKWFNNLVDRSGVRDYWDIGSNDASGGNYSGDATSPQTANRNATIFEDLSDPANGDLELTADASYGGTDLSADSEYPFSVDINGVTRVDWDAGIHEVIVSGNTITASITESGDTVAASLVSPRNVVSNISEDGDTIAASIVSLRNIIASITELGDTSAASIVSLRNITTNIAEAGDTTAASMVGVVTLNITANINEAGDAVAASIQVPRNIAAAISELGDTTAASMVGILTSSITANVAEDGDAVSAVINNIRQIISNITEAGDTVAASIVSPRNIVTSISEDGDSIAAALDVLVKITSNITEEGDVTAASMVEILVITLPEEIILIPAEGRIVIIQEDKRIIKLD